jgi:hypothetical protein
MVAKGTAEPVAVVNVAVDDAVGEPRRFAVPG